MSFIKKILPFFLFVAQSSFAIDISGQATLNHKPLPNAKISLWQTQGFKKPYKLTETTTDQNGAFFIQNVPENPERNVFYVIAKSPDYKGLTLLSILGEHPFSTQFVNELTTVAASFTFARFFTGNALQGNPQGLLIASYNTPNLVDSKTGSWGSVLTDPINSTENTTLARLNTLAALITATTFMEPSWIHELQKACSLTDRTLANDTLEILAAIAYQPWVHSEKIYELFNQAYPQPHSDKRRQAPFAPYLAYSPKDFSLMLKFVAGGIYSPGKLGVDRHGNIWSGLNWLAGSQSGVIRNIGGGTVKLRSDGVTLSPPISGFTGMGVDGIGWGTGVSNNNIWVTSFNGSIGVMDLEGNPIASEKAFPFDHELGNLMGVGVAKNGDVWIADATKDQLVYFPNGQIQRGKLVHAEGLSCPFGIAIDDNQDVWVSNTLSNKVIRFPTNNPTDVQHYQVGGGGTRGVALDSKGNLWVASNFSKGFPPPHIPDGTPIMKQFQISLRHLKTHLHPGERTGVVNVIRPDGSIPSGNGYTANGAIVVPWGISIDGNDNVWVGNFLGKGVVLLTGDHNDKTIGDPIHVFQSGSIEYVTDVVIDPAGNVWVANNWKDLQAVDDNNPDRSTSTWGGGMGIVAIYGVASPVQTPVLGQVQSLEKTFISN